MNVNNLRESPLVQGATEARRPTAWWLAAILIVVVAILAVGGVADLVYGALIPNAEGSIAAQVSEFFVFGAGLLALWLWLRFKEQRSFSSVGLRGSSALPRFLIGLAIGAGMITLGMLLLIFTGQYQTVPAPPNGLSGAAALLPVLLLVIVVAVQSGTEEIQMRGYLLQTSALQLPGWLAILVGGLLFSVLHVVTGNFELVAVVNILLYAFFTSFVALRQGSLWMVCGIHAGWNWFQGNVFTVPVSGAAPYANGIFHFGPTETATRWLSGGSFGPENSLVVTLVWGIAVLLAYRYFRSPQPRRAATPPRVA